MSTCKSCKHWTIKSDVSRIVFPPHPVTFKHPADEAQVVQTYGYRVRYCLHPKILFYQRPERDGAAVVDGSQYHAALLTAEDFGCVLHEHTDAPLENIRNPDADFRNETEA